MVTTGTRAGCSIVYNFAAVRTDLQFAGVCFSVVILLLVCGEKLRQYYSLKTSTFYWCQLALIMILNNIH